MKAILVALIIILMCSCSTRPNNEYKTVNVKSGAELIPAIYSFESQ